MRPPRLRVITLMTWTVVIALALALVAQRSTAERRYQDLKSRSARLLTSHFALEGMNRILSDRGIDILKQSTGVELLRLSRRTRSTPEGPSIESVVIPTGVALDAGVALKAACVLLDHRNFGYINSDDFPEPQVGLRIQSGHSSLDILISLEGSSRTRPHQDVWIEIRDEGGKLVHSAGPNCLHDPTLQGLAEVLAGM